jgi:hypothetical protein
MIIDIKENNISFDIFCQILYHMVNIGDFSVMKVDENYKPVTAAYCVFTPDLI